MEHSLISDRLRLPRLCSLRQRISLIVEISRGNGNEAGSVEDRTWTARTLMRWSSKPDG